jgi:hypothetical protein
MRLEGAAVFKAITHQFPGYTFQITEDPQSQEILVSVIYSIFIM